MSAAPDTYQRAEDFETRIDSVLLADEAWAVFAQLEKPATLAELAAATGLDAAMVQRQVESLVQSKLVRKKLVNWREFLAQKGINSGTTRMSPAGPQPAPAVLAALARKPPTVQPPAKVAAGEVAIPPAPAPSRTATPARRIAPRVHTPEPSDPEGTISFRLDNDGARRARRASLAMCITFRLGGVAEPRSRVTPRPPLPAPEPDPVPVAVPVPEPELVAASAGPDASAPAAAASGFAPRRLRRLVEAITAKGGGGLQGQLLVYRVFLRVPPALMFAAGIKSLNLVDDSLELSDERTYDAIRSAARTVAALDLDEIAL